MNCLNTSLPEVKKLVADFGETLVAKLFDENFEEREIPSYEEFLTNKNVKKALNIISISKVSEEIGTSYPKLISQQQLINLKRRISQLNNKNKEHVFILFNLEQQGKADLYSWGLRKVPGKLDIQAKLDRAIAANTKTAQSESNIQELKKMLPGIQTTLFQTSNEKLNMLINKNLDKLLLTKEEALVKGKKMYNKFNPKFHKGLIQDIATGSYNSETGDITIAVHTFNNNTTVDFLQKKKLLKIDCK